MATFYATTQDIEEFLGYQITPKPGVDVVEKWISRAMGYIERKTRHSWREKKIVGERHRIQLGWMWTQPSSVFLHQRFVKQFDSTKGDSWKVWNGSIWEDWLTGAAQKVENTDYMVEYEVGKVNIRPFVYYPLRFANLLDHVPMVFSYRYGEDGNGVPEDITEATIKYVAIQLIETNEFQAVLPDGTDRVNLVDKSRIWRQEVDSIIANRSEVLVF